MQAWRIEIRVRGDLPDPAGRAAGDALADAVGATPEQREILHSTRSIRGYLIGAEAGRPTSPAPDGPTLDGAAVERFAAEVLADPICDQVVITEPDATVLDQPGRLSIQPRPGVTDAVAHSVCKAMLDAGLPEVTTASFRAFDLPLDDLPADWPPPSSTTSPWVEAATQGLANEVVQQVTLGRSPTTLPGPGPQADLSVQSVPVRELDEAALVALSVDGGLALDAHEMRTIQAHYQQIDREPLRLELETLAQTWSEHCKHKTLTGRIKFRDDSSGGEVTTIDSLLKTTIAHVTNTLEREFCVSVFEDNAGIVDFDGEDCVCIKVETHNRPSALEPFGGAGTGVGGVIRDILGTGLGARPVASTDVFCFAPHDLEPRHVPTGCLAPETVLRGVVAGVRDYGNPMGIPTVNGSVHFDPNFVGNPLVYVGCVGILPRSLAFKKTAPGDKILAIGGRTGRDGIHGATFSSLGLHTESESVSSGAVQIGDPISERIAMDALLRMRDEGLYSAVTDCGAGGFSSAIGEMAEGLGADVDLAAAPLKYQGLAPWEIWVSEAQERMVFSVPPQHLERALEVCAEEGCEATVLGTFEDSGRLVVRHGETVHGDLDMKFLHDGLPTPEREAVWSPAAWAKQPLVDPDLPPEPDLGAVLIDALRDPNVASKEWIIRQYDHEVQAGSAGKPLCGIKRDGPADAAVLAPKLGSKRGIVLSNGLNPRLGHIDPAAMAENALDEAMRNLVAAGGDPDQTCVLDNYCWASTNKPEQLGGLVRASFALRDLALTYRTPFVSGKDSLHNEFTINPDDATANATDTPFALRDRTIEIPGCILVTAMGVIPDVDRTLTSALRAAGSGLWLVGLTKRELAGSILWKRHGHLGATPPRVDADAGKAVLEGTYRAIQAKAAVAAHDLSEGGLGVAVAEMMIGGRLGAEIDLEAVPMDDALRAGLDTRPEEALFSESASRLLLEVPTDREQDFLANLHGVPCARIGTVIAAPTLRVSRGTTQLFEHALPDLVHAFKHPLDLDRTMTEHQS